MESSHNAITTVSKCNGGYNICISVYFMPSSALLIDINPCMPKLKLSFVWTYFIKKKSDFALLLQQPCMLIIINSVCRP